MEIQKYLEQMGKIQSLLIEFIQNEDTIEEKYQNLITFLDDLKIRDNQNDFKSLLYLILNISNNHHRNEGFFYKIEQILSIFKEEIKKYFLNFEIFNIFKSNKRIILYLIDEKILTLDKSIVYIMTTDKYQEAKYPLYFFNEIKPFINDDLLQDISKQQPEDNNEKRRIGENDKYIRELVQKDLIEEFSVFVLKSNLSLTSTIESSFFETNLFLIKNQPTLIEYAAFYGSIKIFKYLIDNNVQLTPSLWLYAIHGQNIEIIHLLEEKSILPEDHTYGECLNESIKCHHNEIANYIRDNLLKLEGEPFDVFHQSLKYYNFAYIKKDDIKKSSFYYLCKYDYFPLVEFLLKEDDINLNERKILKFIFFNSVLNLNNFEYNFISHFNSILKIIIFLIQFQFKKI